MKNFLRCLTPTLALCSAALAQTPTIDGTADPLYCEAVVIQDTSTGFGNANNGQVGICNGSELDQAFAYVNGGTLYLVFAGNLEHNFNKLEIFFDTIAGGQNQLRNDNGTGGVNDGVNRMGGGLPANPPGPGLKFDAGFDADYWISVTGGPNNPATYSIFLDYARLRPNVGDAGETYYLGQGQEASETVGGALTGGTNPNNILATIDNSNVAGVAGGNGGLDSGAGVRTGVELAIPLAAIGTPTGTFKICAFINGQQHDFCSNQFLGGTFGAANLGEPRNLDLTAAPVDFTDQNFSVSLVTPPCGACCDLGAQTCSQTTQVNCAGGGFQWTANLSCDGNPCDNVVTGACCLGTNCSIDTATGCTNQGGIYAGDGSTCATFPCANVGACCNGTSCSIVIDAPACTGGGGEYLGIGTNCDASPCATGACCVNGGCQTLREEQCLNLDGDYFGDGSTCGTIVCDLGRCCIDDKCFVIRGDECTALGGAFAVGLDCTGNPCGTPVGQPEVDGLLDLSYTGPWAVQDTETGFGNATGGLIDFAGGSELDVAWAAIKGGKLYLLLAGNLESNFNKLEVFFDTIPGGQNQLRNDNPDVDFNGLNRMGTDTVDPILNPGLKFDAGFEPDYYFTCTHGGQANRPSTSIFANFVRMRTSDTDPGEGYFLGEGRAANYTRGGLLNRNPGGNNPFGIMCTLDNSNILGVIGGFAAGDGSGVTTGVEICIPLSAIGDPTGVIKVCAFINGQGHDFAANQFLAGEGAFNGNNYGEPRRIDLTLTPGDQFFLIYRQGDMNCDGAVNILDINAFVQALADPAGYALTYPDCSIELADINKDGDVNVLDINFFVALLSGG
ncbi:hypothetical protein RAS1_36770 [Phycisphaerae bacterium RAS1]|nr:hypothetical protein RAS1_36770 [Phycisphaerae bacterium RAS1]